MTRRIHSFRDELVRGSQAARLSPLKAPDAAHQDGGVTDLPVR
jgi:hypothetical protein